MQIAVMKTTAIVHVHNNGVHEMAESDETDKSVCCNAAFSSFKEAINAETSHHNLRPILEGSPKLETPQSAEGEDKEGGNNNENAKDDVPELTNSSATKLLTPETMTIIQPFNLFDIEEEVEPSSTKLNCINDITIQNEDVADENSAEEESSTSIRKVVISKRVSILKASLQESSSGEIGAKNSNKKLSYPEIVSKRKKLIQIHRITDSDNRTRDKMRKKGLSPPSSSDGENWYIGFIAYPTQNETESFRTTARRKSRDIACFAFNSIKFLFSPVTKACERCKRNKVGDDDG